MAEAKTAQSDGPEISLDVDPGTVCFLIIRARAFDAKVGAAEQDTVSQPGEDEMHDALEDYGDDPVGSEIREAIDGMNEDEQAELVAMTWIGRGDFTASEWAEAIAAARERHSGPSSEYLLGMPLLGDLLEEGFTALGYTCEDYESPI